MRFIALFSAVTILGFAAIFARATATPAPQTHEALQGRPPAAASERLMITNDPFAPLRHEGQRPVDLSAGNAVFTPVSQQPMIVLCQTLAASDNPVAEFYVGNDPIVAAIGSDVGGYHVASIDTDGVNFTTGERLVVAPCPTGGAQTDTVVPNPSGAAVPLGAPNAAPLAPGLPTPFPGPAQRGPANPTTLQSAPYSAGAPASALQGSPYQGSSSTAAPNVYGAPAPTPPPNYFPAIVPKH